MRHPSSWPALSGLLLLLTLLAANASASLPSRVSLENGSDNQGGRSTTLFLDYEMWNKWRLNLLSSRSIESIGPIDYTSNSSLLGVVSDPLAPFSFGLSFEHFDNEEQFIIDTVALMMSVNRDNWTFSLSPSSREIEIHGVTLLGREFAVEVKSQSLALALDYYFDSGFQAGFSLAWFDYSEDVSRLNAESHPVIASYISPVALSQVQGLEKRNNYLDLGYAFDKWIIGLTFGKSESAVDESITRLSMIHASILLSKHWDLSLTAGQQRLEDVEDSQVRFGSVGVGFSW